MFPNALSLLAGLFILSPCVHAAANGMDMSMDGAMSLAGGHMLNYIHFDPGDTLWFMGWVPLRANALFGACLGLFLLAIIERWIAACRALMEAHWRASAQMVLADQRNRLPTSAAPPRKTLWVPFIPAHDITRGAMHAVQSALSMLFMLAIMTFQGGYVVALVLGAGVGETMFGRYMRLGPRLA